MIDSLLALAPTVHTTGINVEGVLATAASVTVMLGAVITAIGWALRNANREDTRQVIKEEVLPEFELIRDDIAEIRKTVSGHDTRLARIEGLEQGKQFIIDQQTRNRRQTDGP